MLALNLAFKKKDTYQSLIAEPVQVTATARNIASVVYRGYNKRNGKYMWRVTTVGLVANQIAPGMLATLAGTAGHDGSHEVIFVDVANQIVDIENTVPRGIPNGGAAGTLTPAGVVSDNVRNLGNMNTNGINEDLGYRSYTTSESFVIRANSEAEQPIIQVTEMGTSGVTVTIRYSLDRVNWIAFPTPISAVAIGSGATGGFLMNQINFNDIYIRIDVTVGGASSNYYVLAR